MASEITYAEVKFKNASPAAVVKVPPEKKKREHHPQKYPLWLPWLISLLLLLVCIALVTALLVAPFSHSGGQPTALQQNFMEWRCISELPQGKEQGWTCCPKGWKRFQKSCYFFSNDTMHGIESEQNCTGMGSHLVVINSEAEQEFLFNLAKGVFTKAYETKYYIGLTAYKNGQWQWVDQTPYKKAATFWKPGEPNLLFAEKCAAIHVKGNRDSSTYSNWNNVLCFTSCYRICELAVKFV
ncbi:C-type lectin domain family 4 member E-like isoform X2 [Accipiter gentilis]|uniref:C-type lectin domain family 4 member E-like isoform X2 n=1 Tax=Astur gentilis TaxID=8957 RepID=UPI00210FFE62|nr:C-type lectin domain family 4 member E-like isoform X2 [Accipiter gentilis]